ncbi:Squalene/phytoene synthase family protein [Candida parapsilosis]|uniref:Uncharacterized protein n=2 Tax=Candida parapsilosis TaxID=5480 RepID=G8BGS0_CANPC|nr:uncharacterized protein CPAR2_502920 [Candida parapsilosis]KAF6044674.1 Squalene/phytoene synthase family protein [Candida parapsilosis]KAF6044938.1 Squalene/phytoene synthase family protein [Candida parapsilosis]KAF6048915.1 Squalene/phytoene synthase family protein [Candida parapsilosis]KAF6060915.1 Squalene/phytoene synthase family protein [Candida parapsilosis]KAI5905849.1 hypothetical protein K4G60_g5120 [Candida parapsilosis]
MLANRVTIPIKTAPISSIFIRYSSTSYESLLHNSVESVSQILEKSDRSSYILAQYIPEPARNTFLAIRAFNLEINKINEGGKNVQSRASMASRQMTQTLGVSTGDLKFKFWSDLLLRVFTEDSDSSKDLGEPIAILLRDGLKNNMNIDLSFLQKFLQTKRSFIKNNASFSTINEICSYGEGTYSQLNYLTQQVLLSPSISPSSIQLLQYSPTLQSLLTDIAAHIGQATAIASMITGVRYYASTRNQVPLPIDVMSKHDLSQEDVLRLFQGHTADAKNDQDVRHKINSVVYDTAVVANDHMLTANKKLGDFKKEVAQVITLHSDDKSFQNFARKWRGKIPDAIFTPLMVGIPTSLYLKKLEKHDFDILNTNLQQPEWRLAWTSFKDYYLRKI